jgi:hypothetical protein
MRQNVMQINRYRYEISNNFDEFVNFWLYG